MQNLRIATKIKWGSPEEFCDHTKQELKDKNLLLLATNSSIDRLHLFDWLEFIKKNNQLIHLACIPSNPSYLDIYNAVREISTSKIDLVMAIGGGSAIDMAKAVVGLRYLKDRVSFSADDILHSLKTKEYLHYKQNLPIHAVPTTAGTGAEVTSWATIWAPDSKEKHSIDAPWLLADTAFIVPEFTISMPKRLTLSTGLDALCQAVEAYWAKASNPMVKVLSISSIELIVKYLPKTLKDLKNRYYREQMCLGSLFSGLAFTNTRTTACHSISYPLTMEYNIEHGLACALSLAEVLRINQQAIAECDELLLALKVGSYKDLQAWIDKIADGIVTMRLSNFAIKEADLKRIARLSFTQGRMDNNPVKITEQDVEKTLLNIF